MIRLILSLLFGILPQALYFMLYLTKVKDIMKMAEREKEHYKTIKEMLENRM